MKENVWFAIMLIGLVVLALIFWNNPEEGSYQIVNAEGYHHAWKVDTRNGDVYFCESVCQKLRTDP